eukprot:jgi/Chrzof1/8720/Cz03g21250.t1
MHHADMLMWDSLISGLSIADGPQQHAHLSDSCQAEASQDPVGWQLRNEFEEHSSMLAAALDAVESRSQLLASQVGATEARSHEYTDRLNNAQGTILRLRTENEACKDREQLLSYEVSRLTALLETQTIQSVVTEERLQSMLEEERQLCDRLRLVREDALQQRDDALSELATAYADIDAMQATLADSAVYVRQLRKKVIDLELQQCAHRARAGQARDQDEGIFSLASIKAAIQQAVKEAGRCDDAEKKKRIRQLQLRWHPDKNPVLKEFATEVTKLINEAVTQ